MEALFNFQTGICELTGMEVASGRGGCLKWPRSPDTQSCFQNTTNTKTLRTLRNIHQASVTLSRHATFVFGWHCRKLEMMVVNQMGAWWVLQSVLRILVAVVVIVAAVLWKHFWTFGERDAPIQ